MISASAEVHSDYLSGRSTMISQFPGFSGSENLRYGINLPIHCFTPNLFMYKIDTNLQTRPHLKSIATPLMQSVGVSRLKEHKQDRQISQACRAQRARNWELQALHGLPSLNAGISWHFMAIRGDMENIFNFFICEYLMSKAETNTHLLYGQGILIKGCRQESAGLLTAKGFADTRALFEAYDDILYFKNYRNSIFQILPASSFDINDELKWITENNLDTTVSNLEMLKAKAISEKNQFNLYIESKNKAEVCFGDEVIFKHIDSGTYLSGTITPSDGTRGAFLVEVTKDLKSALVFKLLPYRSFERESSPIPLQSPVLIQNVHNKGFLTAERVGIEQKKQKNMFWEKSPIKSDESYRIPIKTESASSQIFECVTHFADLSLENETSKMPWKFQLHFNDADNDILVQHDIVYFQHTENNGVLAAIGEEEIGLKESKNQKTSELEFFDCVWEIEEYPEFGKDYYILRHLMSGMTLGVDVVESEHTRIRPKLIDITDGKTNNDGAADLGIELKLAKKQPGIIGSKSYINICSGDMCLDICREKQEKKEKEVPALLDNQGAQTSQREIVDTSEISRKATNEINFSIQKLEFTMDVSKHCFVIQEINDDLKSEVLFALSFHSRLIKLREDLKWGAEFSEEKVTYLRMMQITSKVREIKYFLKKTTIDDPNRDFKRPIEKRQIICYHLGIAQLLFELLFFMKKNLDGEINKDGKLTKSDQTIFKTKPNQLEKFIELYNAIYEVIFELIRDNYQFKVHVTKWINFILNDVIGYNEDYQLKTLLELLNRNSFFINSFVDENLVSHLVSCMNKPALIQDKSPRHVFYERKYIEIFRAFCVCGNEVYSENQVFIVNKFLKKLPEQEYEIYDIKLSKKKNKEGVYEIYCEAAVDKQTKKVRKFEDYYKICRDEYPSAWQYLVSFLNLVAEMTQGRNKTVEAYVEALLSSDVISDLMTNYELFEAEAPIIRIMHYLYAESERFYPIDRSTRVINYNTLDEQATLNSSKAKVKPRKLLSQVMDTLIIKLKKFRPILPKNVSENQRLYVILDFVRETFHLGFWESRSEVIEIFKCIEIILSPHIDINYEEIRSQSQKPETVLMIKCKEKCLEILDHMIDLDIDYSLMYLSKTFKDFQLPEKKISVEIVNFLKTSQQCNFAVDFIHQYKRETRGLENMVSVQICKSMTELSKYGDARITSFSLKILERILDMDKKVSDNFMKLIFICSDERIGMYEYLEKKRDKFFTLEYQNTTKMTIESQKSQYFMIYKDDVDSGIMQDLYMLSELVKNENSLSRINDIKTLDSSKTFQQLATKKLINFTSERRSSNIMKQRIVDASNIHWKVLRYIFNCRQFPQGNLAPKLLHLCYKFLVSIIENNQGLKLELIQHIPLMIHHVKENLGCIDFLKEMYDNNRNMLYNEVEILALIKLVCNTIEEQPSASSWYKSKLLDFFRYLIYCNNRALSYNQIQILKIMQDDSYQNIILDINLARIEHLVSKFEEDNYPASDSGKVQPEIQMEPELVYLTTYFQIMVSLIDDKCSVNIGKLVKKYPFNELISSIKLASRCWPLKRNLRAFLNRLYYFEAEIKTYLNTIIKEEIDNIIIDLNHFIDIKCKVNANEFEARYFENPVRFSFIESYLYLNLEENLFTLHQMITKQELRQEFENFLHSKNSSSMEDGPYAFIRICERLGWIRNYFIQNKNILTNRFIRYLLLHLKEIIQEFDDNVYAAGMMFIGERMPLKTEKDRERKNVIDKIIQGEITTFFVQASAEREKKKPLVYLLAPKVSMVPSDKEPNKEKLIRKLRQILTRTKREFENQDEEVCFRQQKIITALKLSTQVREEFIRSYNEKLSTIGSTEKLACHNNTIISYIKSIIEINSQDPSAFEPQAKLFFIRMIIGIFEQTNQGNESRDEIDLWEPEHWEKNRSSIESLQILLKKCDLQVLIAEMLKEKIEDNIPLANEILLCGIAFLLGGNQTTQKAMIEEIFSDADNKVFRNLASLISKLGKLILKNIDESKIEPSNNDEFQIEIIDNYDFYEEKEKLCRRKNVLEPSSTNELIYYQACIVTYRRAFRFLQLLCENNNIANKHNIREQPKKLENVNFITVATNELRNLFSAMCKSIVTVPIFLLDFLLEVTQIPIKQNQEALTNSSFFEDVCQMNNEFKPEKLGAKNFAEGSFPLEEIFMKTVQIILSNFEGNDHNTYTLLDSKVDPKFLVSIMEVKLNSIEVTNKTELLLYIKESLQETQQGGRKVISPTYTEELMNIFDIIIIFMKLKEKLGLESRLHISYEKFKAESPERTEMFEYLEKCLIKIEINDSSNKKQSIYFPKQPAYYSLSDTTRDYIMGEVERKTHRDKIVSLFGYVKSLKHNLEYSYNLKKTEGLVEKDMQANYKIAACMSVVICIYLMLYYHVIIEFGEAEFSSSRVYTSICFFLSLMQLSFSVVYFSYWYRLRVWYKPEYIPNSAGSQAAVETPPEQHHSEQSWFNKIREVFSSSGEQESGEKVQTFYNNGEFYRLFMFLSVSLLGTFYNPTIFFVHIIDIFCQSEMLASIFKAIALNIQSLAYVSFMGVVFVVVFCTVTFSNYMKNVYEDEDPRNMCNSMVSCILALYVSGAIGEAMEKFEVTRFAYDLIYSTFFGILFSNIVSGIMLDSFASLRENNEELQTDKSNYCYICNVARQVLEKRGIKFYDHITQKHFLWNYVFYLISLRNKNQTDYTGLEYEIIQQYNQEDENMVIRWIPDGEQVGYNPTRAVQEIIDVVNGFSSNLEQGQDDLLTRIEQLNENLQALA